jgi:hypothetical protein
LSLTTAEPEKIAIFVKIATSKISDKKRDNPADAPEFSILEMLADVYIASRREIQGRFEDFHEENLIQRALYERVFPNRWTFIATRIVFAGNSNRSEDYSTGFIIDYAYTLK